MGVSKNNGTPKSSMLIGFSIINHPFWGTTIIGNNRVYIYIDTLPKFNSSPLKSYRNPIVVFQPPFLRGEMLNFWGYISDLVQDFICSSGVSVLRQPVENHPNLCSMFPCLGGSWLVSISIL